MNEHFTEEHTYMAEKHMKRCLTSLTITEMQIKTMIYHDIPIRMNKRKCSDKNNYSKECRDIRCLIHCFWKYNQPFWKYYPAIILLGTYPRDWKLTLTWKPTHTQATLVKNGQNWKQSNYGQNWKQSNYSNLTVYSSMKS